jgi:hypothetical protein
MWTCGCRSPVSPTAAGTAIPESTPTLVHFHAMVLFITMIKAVVGRGGSIVDDGDDHHHQIMV